MRMATLALAVLGMLLIGTAAALAQEWSANPTDASYLTAATDQAVVTPVRRYIYGPAPAWGGYYYAYPRYYGYRPYAYGYAPRPYYGYYYPSPYAAYGYYQPYGFGFTYAGPRRSFSFGF